MKEEKVRIETEYSGQYTPASGRMLRRKLTCHNCGFESNKLVYIGDDEDDDYFDNIICKVCATTCTSFDPNYYDYTKLV